MSKDKPEVGDVWQRKKDGRLIRITSISYAFGVEPVYAYIWNNGYLEYSHVLHKRLINEYTYLGKSKVNIEDLFKTENER